VATSRDSAAAAVGGRRILVTGGSGFLGTHLVRALLGRDAEVTVVDRTGRPPASGVETLTLDLLEDDLGDVLACRPFDFVFHLAGNVEVPLSVERPDLDLAANAGATLRVLEALRRASPRTGLLLTSTAAVYGEAPDGPCPETQPPTPVAPYGASKWLAEAYTDLFARQDGLRTVRARIFSMYGPGLRKHVVHDLIEKVHRDPERLEVLGDGGHVRDFLYVEDAVEALVHLSESAPCRGEAWNVASGRPVSIAELARAVCRASGVAPSIEFVGEATPGTSRRWIADVSRLRALGVVPRVPLDEGLARTVAWYRRTTAGARAGDPQ
jgi:UDP-glucose 4-epimerase